MPPLTFGRVGILRIDKVGYGPIQIKLATVDGASAQCTFLCIQLIALLTFQGFDGGVPHGYQILFGLFAHVGYFAEFGHGCSLLSRFVLADEDREKRGVKQRTWLKFSALKG